MFTMPSVWSPHHVNMYVEHMYSMKPEMMEWRGESKNNQSWRVM